MNRRNILIFGFLLIVMIDLIRFVDLSSLEWRRWVPAIVLFTAVIVVLIRYELKERQTKQRESVNEEQGSVLPLIVTFVLILGLQAGSATELVPVEVVVFLQPVLLVLALWLGFRSPPQRQDKDERVADRQAAG